MHVSVAMATYNGERFIAEQLESIARQSRVPDELVLADDASSDQTVEIASRFARRAPFDVVILRNQERLGHAGNFFRAMAACTGEVIALCDQDDVWHPEKIARCERPLRLDSKVALVAHSARVVDEHFQFVMANWPRIRVRRLLPAGSVPPFACNRYPGFTLMFRSVFLRATDLPNRQCGAEVSPAEGVPVGHDLWVTLVCGALGAVALLPDELVLYRRHASAVTHHGRHEGRSHLVRRSLALRTEETSYEAKSTAGRARATYLARLRPLSRELGPSASVGLERAIQSHHRYAEAMERRASTYSATGVRMRAGRVIHHALRGDYGRPSKGGLGLASLGRDVIIGLGHHREVARESTMEHG
jgi:glycosyltransferase involved in cell wall biosynthesis